MTFIIILGDIGHPYQFQNQESKNSKKAKIGTIPNNRIGKYEKIELTIIEPANIDSS